MARGRPVESWVRRCGVAAVLAALPTVVWRAVLTTGATLGTPASWRRSEAVPGSGTTYVLSLSALQLVAALLTLVLLTPQVRRLPQVLVLTVSWIGAVLLAAVCVLSAINWSKVDPFRDAAVDTGWTYLCWACYAAALLWPPLLVATIIGYRQNLQKPAEQVIR